MKSVIYLVSISMLFVACNNGDKKGTADIKKTGDPATTLGTSTQTIQGQIKISSDLKSKGLKFGKYTIEKGNRSENYNVLHVYVVFDNDIKEDINVRVYDKNESEYGRIVKKVKGKSGDAKWIDFEFDNRTDLENGSRFEIE